MVQQALKNTADEIALMLVMTSPGDKPGLKMLIELCADLAKTARGQPGYERVVAAAEFIEKNCNSDQLFDLLQSFTNALTSYLENRTTVSFPNEEEALYPREESSPQENKDSEYALVDRQFLVEYLETHIPLLDDLEASLLEFQSSGGEKEELTISVKRYLHNLKGDSGSIGMAGIERACHAVEDILNDVAAADFTAQLIQFKEWCVTCMKAVASETEPPQSADDLLENLKTAPVHLTPVPNKEKIVHVETSSETSYVLTGEPEILVEFASEAEEHLLNVESIVLGSEGAFSKDDIDTIFRGVHSLKGGSAYFTIEEMTKCSHILENFLTEVRDGKREFDKPLSDLVLTYIDLQKNVLSRCKEAMSKGGKMETTSASIQYLQSLEDYGRGVVTPKKEQVVETSSASSGPREVQEKSVEKVADHPDPGSDKFQIKSFVKVETARLDYLIDSIGEMVIYSSMLIRHCRELLGTNQAVMDATQRVEKFSRDLQDVGMSMRLVPIKSLFQKMSRLVWDTSKKLNKDIEFTMEGEDTELDRNLIDKLADPLMHMVRNSLDHGIESREEREKSGKSKTGAVKLSAYHSGGSIHVKIQDDGRGLNPEKLIAKAIEKGILPVGAKLSPAEAYQLIFAAGFSTAQAVTDISGRGVGMDVVRRNVESLRGRIHIESEVNQGSTFTIELPLTLAIIDGIQIVVGSESFLIPSLSIIEFVKPKREMITCALDSGETLYFRGKYLPIYRLGNLYDIEPKYSDPCHATLVVVENNNEQVAVMVDEILGECSTVIKSLGSVFEEGKGIAGCAIMPHGNVALILDVRSLVQLARTEYRSPHIESARLVIQ